MGIKCFFKIASSTTKVLTLELAQAGLRAAARVAVVEGHRQLPVLVLVLALTCRLEGLVLAGELKDFASAFAPYIGSQIQLLDAGHVSLVGGDDQVAAKSGCKDGKEQWKVHVLRR